MWRKYVESPGRAYFRVIRVRDQAEVVIGPKACVKCPVFHVLSDYLLTEGVEHRSYPAFVWCAVALPLMVQVHIILLIN